MAKERHDELAQAIKEIMEEKGLKAPDIYKPLNKAQGTVYGWLNGDFSPSLTFLPDIEKVLFVPRGEILWRAGYVDETIDIGVWLQRNGRIAEPLHPMVIQAYETAIRHTGEYWALSPADQFKIARAS